MFLRLPRTVWNDKKKDWEDEPLLINPFHVVTIEVDPDDKKCSILVMANGVDFYIKHRPEFLQQKISEFVKENILQKIYSQMKDKN